MMTLWEDMRIKQESILLLLRKLPCFNHQGDMYMEEGGIHYEIIKGLEYVDLMGILHAPKQDPLEGILNQETTSQCSQKNEKIVNLDMHSSPLTDVEDESSKGGDENQSKNHIKKLSLAGFWTFIKEFLLWRMFQDNGKLVVFKDKLGHCYATFLVAGI